MSERSYPFVDGATTDAEFSAMFRQVFPASVIDGLEVAADSTGLQVKLPVGSGFVRGHFYKNTDVQTLRIDAGGASPRIDTIALRLEYGTANSISVQVKKGTAAADPKPPALTQTDAGVFEYALADVYVTANAVTIGAGDVTDRRVMFADAFKLLLAIVPVTSGMLGDGAVTNSKVADGTLTRQKINPDHRAVSASANTLVERDSSGRAQFATPDADGDAATKSYVDNHEAVPQDGSVTGRKIEDGAVTQSKINPDHMATWASPNTLVQRDGSGRSQFATPSAATDAANKAYVDGRTPTIYTQSGQPSNPAYNDLWVW